MWWAVVQPRRRRWASSACLAVVIAQQLVSQTAAHDDHDAGPLREWEARAPMPFAVSDLTATVVAEHTVILVGGCDAAQLSCDAYPGCTYCPSITARAVTYTTDDDRWRALPDAPRERYRHAAAYDAATNALYVVGGRTLEDDLIEVVDVLDVAHTTWTPSAMAPAVARSDLAAFAYGGAIFAYGGYDATYTALGSGVAFRPATGVSWTPPALMEPRGDFGIGLVELSSNALRAYAVGGWSHGDWCNPLASVESIALDATLLEEDDGTTSWVAAPELAVARGDKAVAGFAAHVFAVGGEHNNGCATPSEPIYDVEALDAAALNDDWTEWAALPEARFRFAAVALDDHLYVFGGQTPHLVDGCPGDASFCFPVVDHAWRLHLGLDDDEDEGGDSGDSKKKKKSSSSSSPSGVGMFFIGLAAGLLAGLLVAAAALRACARDRDRANHQAAIMLTDKVFDTNADGAAPPEARGDAHGDDTTLVGDEAKRAEPV